MNWKSRFEKFSTRTNILIIFRGKSTSGNFTFRSFYLSWWIRVAQSLFSNGSKPWVAVSEFTVYSLQDNWNMVRLKPIITEEEDSSVTLQWVGKCHLLHRVFLLFKRKRFLFISHQLNLKLHCCDSTVHIGVFCLRCKATIYNTNRSGTNSKWSSRNLSGGIRTGEHVDMGRAEKEKRLCIFQGKLQQMSIRQSSQEPSITSSVWPKLFRCQLRRRLLSSLYFAQLLHFNGWTVIRTYDACGLNSNSQIISSPWIRWYNLPLTRYMRWVLKNSAKDRISEGKLGLTTAGNFTEWA